jgi:hypothetical protein
VTEHHELHNRYSADFTKSISGSMQYDINSVVEHLALLLQCPGSILKISTSFFFHFPLIETNYEGKLKNFQSQRSFMTDDKSYVTG